MLPIVTPEEMAAIDAAASEPVEVLIERAGAAVARTARRLLGGTYGRRVVVIAGKGNNGNDGRVAARRLRALGVAVVELDAARLPDTLPACDLVIDAAYGTGFRGTWSAPRRPERTRVLAVDIPSGVDGLTGEAGGSVLRADVTVTFAAYKPGLLFEPGRSLAGSIEVADIGLDVSGPLAGVPEASDIGRWIGARAPDAHKWRAAVYVLAGSSGMLGAAMLASRAAQRAGAGMVRLGTPGGDGNGPVEVVGEALPGSGFETTVLEALGRCHALVVGPGLGRAEATVAAIRALIAASPIPVVADADALYAIGSAPVVPRRAPLVLTPHDGEYERLVGHRPGADRIDAARALARHHDAVVLLKGSTTVVAGPDGRVHVVLVGDERLATAGTGDVLSGVIGALVATGTAPFEATTAAAYVHGRAGTLGWRRGLVAGDLLDLLPAAFASLPGA
ncbi:MAG: NAD(P)H-hydrate dehydratase [Acidimicrobiia bacterium]